MKILLSNKTRNIHGKLTSYFASSINLFLIFFVSLLCLNPSIGREVKKITLPAPVQQKLAEIFLANESLHSAMLSQNQNEINNQIKILERAIEGAIKSSTSLKSTHKKQNSLDAMVLDKNLEITLAGTRRHLKFALERMGDERKTNLKEALRLIVLLARSYELPSKYKIFFCRSDKAEWIQTGSRPRNPLNPDLYPKCGVVVR